MRTSSVRSAMLLAAGAAFMTRPMLAQGGPPDSATVERVLEALQLQRVADSLDAIAQATTQLSAPVAFVRGSTALSERTRSQLRTKAWLLWANPSARVQLQASADTGINAAEARAIGRSRIDAIRTYLRARGVAANQVTVDIIAEVGEPSTDPAVTFAVSGPVDVADVPPETASPPEPVGTLGLDPTTGRAYAHGTVRIFYATDRARENSPEAEKFYTGERSAASTLEFGRIEVSIPRVHRAGAVERPAWYAIDRTPRTGAHVLVRRVQPMAMQTTFDSVRRTVAASGSKEALIFIHGYNVSFNDAAMRTAQLAYDLRFDGAPILYSWPSRASLFRYSADRDAAEWSAAHLQTFIDSIVSITGTKRVNIIAHSMGNRALSIALENLARAGRDTILGNVVLAAADVDAARFEQQSAPLISKLARALTIYICNNDWALRASRILAADLRLGEAVNPIMVPTDMHVVDASAARTDLMGHGYVASSARLIDELTQLLVDKLPLPRRLSRQSTAGGRTYWILQ
jgi:esterase/lipase superfamily enzyme